MHKVFAGLYVLGCSKCCRTVGRRERGRQTSCVTSPRYLGIGLEMLELKEHGKGSSERLTLKLGGSNHPGTRLLCAECSQLECVCVKKIVIKSVLVRVEGSG